MSQFTSVLSLSRNTRSQTRLGKKALSRKWKILQRTILYQKAKKKTMRSEYIQMPGFSHVTNKETSTKSRILWTLTCSLVVIICIYQCSERIRYFFTCQPVMNTKLIHRNSIPFPVIVVCPCDGHFRNPSVDSSLLQEMYGNISYSTVYDLMDKTNMSINTLWNISRMVLTSAKFILSHGIRLPTGFQDKGDLLEVSEIFTTSGTCVLAKAKCDILHQGVHTYLGMKDSGNEAGNKLGYKYLYRISYTTEEKLPLLKYFYPMQATTISKKSVNSLTLRMEEVQMLHTWSSPCEDGMKVTKCLMDCLQNKIFSKIINPCRLPYMEPTPKIPECSTSQEFRAMFNATDQVVQKFKREHCKSCNLRQCHEIIYNLESISQRPEDSVFLEVWVFIPESRFPYTQEENIYSLIALFSDIGGGLGLFLGIGVLQIVELLSISCKTILRIIQGRHRLCSTFKI